MTIEKSVKTTQVGGAREGAGRKKSLPEGTKPYYFALTDEERVEVKKFIANMRSKGEKEVSKEEKANEIMIAATSPLAKALYEIIVLFGGRGKGFRRAEEISKIISVVAFKDAVQQWENENPR